MFDQVTGFSPPRPCASFAHFGFDSELMSLIRKLEYTQPTSIQAQAVPTAISGRDIIGIAKTGSGKTAAFLWPLLVHAIDQAELKEGDGPIGLICAPTRELCQQVTVTNPNPNSVSNRFQHVTMFLDLSRSPQVCQSVQPYCDLCVWGRVQMGAVQCLKDWLRDPGGHPWPPHRPRQDQGHEPTESDIPRVR